MTEDKAGCELWLQKYSSDFLIIRGDNLLKFITSSSKTFASIVDKCRRLEIKPGKSIQT